MYGPCTMLGLQQDMVYGLNLTVHLVLIRNLTLKSELRESEIRLVADALNLNSMAPPGRSNDVSGQWALKHPLACKKEPHRGPRIVAQKYPQSPTPVSLFQCSSTHTQSYPKAPGWAETGMNPILGA